MLKHTLNSFHDIAEIVNRNSINYVDVVEHFICCFRICMHCRAKIRKLRCTPHTIFCAESHLRREDWGRHYTCLPNVHSRVAQSRNLMKISNSCRISFKNSLNSIRKRRAPIANIRRKLLDKIPWVSYVRCTRPTYYLYKGSGIGLVGETRRQKKGKREREG